MLTNEHQLLQRSNSTKHRINRVSGKKSICLKFVFWYFKYQLLQKIGRSLSQEIQNFTLVAPTYSKDCYHTFLVKYHGFDRNCWPTNKNRRLRDLAAKNLRIRDAKKWKKIRFQDSFKTPPRSRDWKTNFRDHDFSGYHSPPLDIYFKVNICDIINTVMKKEILVKLTYTRHIHSATYIWSEPL